MLSIYVRRTRKETEDFDEVGASMWITRVFPPILYVILLRKYILFPKTCEMRKEVSGTRQTLIKLFNFQIIL